MARTKLFFGLLTFITFGMIIGSLFQLAFIRKLEEKSGISHWSNDKDADALRLGFNYRYEKNQFYRPHHDYFSDTFNLKRGGQRIATMLMYLSDNVEGGETYFPMAGDGECSCGGKTVKGMCVKPTQGDAVLFWSMGLDGVSDPNSIHGGCEVLEGEKWSATKWMRQRTTN
ncbi:hypothetical protein AAC387_Pa08g2619 [Persea americana]